MVELHEKKISELECSCYDCCEFGHKHVDLNDELIEVTKAKAISVENIRAWAIACVKSCCPEPTPDSLGASPTYCNKCEFLM